MPVYEKLTEKPIATELTEDSYMVLIQGGEVKKILAADFVPEAPGPTGPVPFIKNGTAVIDNHGWRKSGTFQMYEIEDADITSDCVVNVSFNIDDFGTVKEADILPVSESYTGGVRLYANVTPSADINATYTVLKAGE